MELQWTANGRDWKVTTDQYSVTLFSRKAGHDKWPTVMVYRDLEAIARWMAKEGFNAQHGTLQQAVQSWGELRDAFLEAVQKMLAGEKVEPLPPAQVKERPKPKRPKPKRAKL